MKVCHGIVHAMWCSTAIICALSGLLRLSEGAGILGQYTYEVLLFRVFAKRPALLLQRAPLPPVCPVRAKRRSQTQLCYFPQDSVVAVPHKLISAFVHDTHTFSNNRRGQLFRSLNREGIYIWGQGPSTKVPFAQSAQLPRRYRGRKATELSFEKQLSASELRPLLWSANSIISFDVGSSKTGVAVARRQFPPVDARIFGGLVTCAVPPANIGLRTTYLKAFSYGIRKEFEVNALPVLVHHRGMNQLLELSQRTIVEHFATELPCRMAFREYLNKQKDLSKPLKWKCLVVVGVAFNPYLSVKSRMKTPRVLKQIKFASCLKTFLEELVGSPVPVLLQDEGYSSWRAFHALRPQDMISERSNCKNASSCSRAAVPGLDSRAACVLIDDLFSSATRNGRIATFRL